jgi:1-deoxy-D-xylulose-5-phosphate synthase
VLITEQGYGVTVVDPRWVRPIPPELVELAADHRLAVTVEDGVRTGGVGDALAQAMRDAGVATPLHDRGVAPGWHPHGSRGEVLADLGLTAQDVARAVIEAASRLDQATDAMIAPVISGDIEEPAP